MVRFIKDEPGYEAGDIAEEVQGALWDRMEIYSDHYTGILGEATLDAADPGPPTITVIDSYGKTWLVTVTPQEPAHV